MTWTTTHDLDAFLAAAGPFLRAEPAAHTVPLTVLAGLQAGRDSGGGPPLFGWWTVGGGGAVTGAWLRTPPHPLVLAGMPAEAADPLPAHLAAEGHPPLGVSGARTVVERFAAASGRPWRTAMRQRLFALGDLRASPHPGGAARVAGAADRAVLEARWAAFGEETGGLADDPARAVADRLSHGGLTLWEADGAPVSMAGVSRAVEGMVRIGPVHTPRAHRRRGYAAAVTHAVSAAALAAGARHVLLFTDLANPTSNALYARLGYRSAGDFAVLTLA